MPYFAFHQLNSSRKIRFSLWHKYTHPKLSHWNRKLLSIQITKESEEHFSQVFCLNTSIFKCYVLPALQLNRNYADLSWGVPSYNKWNRLNPDIQKLTEQWGFPDIHPLSSPPAHCYCLPKAAVQDQVIHWNLKLFSVNFFSQRQFILFWKVPHSPA